jgi:predicted RNA-binding protein with RPS1 domain
MHGPGHAPVLDEQDRLATGARVTGEVVCHHHFGLGVRVDDRDEYGHVDITAISPREVQLRCPEDFPRLGTRVEVRVLGYSRDQLRLSLRLDE